MIFAANYFFWLAPTTAPQNDSDPTFDTHHKRDRDYLSTITRGQTAFYSVLLSLTLLASFGHVGNVSAATIHYGISDQSVLTTKTNAKGLMENPLLSVAEELFKRAKLDWESQQYPAARMFQKLSEGEANFSILVNSPTLASCCLVGNIPVITTELRVYRNKGTEPVLLTKGLAGKQVITLRGYSYGPLKSFIANPNNHVSAYPTATHTSAFAMLTKQRADYVLDYKQPSIEVLGKHPIKDIQFETLKEVSLYLVLHRNYPNAQDVLLKLERIIKEMDIDAILDLPSDPIKL